MSRSPFTDLLKKAFSDSVKDNKIASKEFSQSRRKFLRDTAYAAGSIVLMPSFLQADYSNKNSAGKKTVAIIGAGIAGLNACYQLKKQGIHATVYEASARAGGRMFTMKDEFGKGITTDIGGEFVDTTHTEIIQLVKELGLAFYDLNDDHLEPKELYFGGKHLTNTDLKNAFAPFVKQLVKDIKSLPEKISWQTAEAFHALDNQSITEYISGIGISGWLYDFIDVVLTREYGMEASEQSAINFLIMFEPPAKSGAYYEMFGESHEVYKIKGGSQQLTHALHEELKQQVVFSHQLIAVDKGSEKNYALSFQSNNETNTIHADYILMAIPFTILRNIKLNIEMPAEKRKCIDEIGYGNSCKFIMGLNSKPWRSAGKQGYTFTDTSFGCGWDSSQSQSEQKGSFTVFGGGHFADEVYKRKTEEMITDFVPGLDRIFPGASTAYNKINIKYCWSTNALAKGGYSSFKKGQWSTLAGWEAVPVGNIYFAGEHVSLDFQGYMNGGAQTGRVAAEKIAEKILKKITTEDTK
jgi:monoamine oxidase